jgi:hypothetical protein
LAHKEFHPICPLSHFRVVRRGRRNFRSNRPLRRSCNIGSAECDYGRGVAMVTRNGKYLFSQRRGASWGTATAVTSGRCKDPGTVQAVTATKPVSQSGAGCAESECGSFAASLTIDAAGLPTIAPVSKATSRRMRTSGGRQEDTGPARHSFKITPSPPQSPGSLSASVWEKVHRWPPMSRTTYCRSP